MILTPNCNALARRAIILLDGKRVRYATFVDDERGIVRCYADPIRSDPYGIGALEEVHHGKVRIVDPEESDYIHAAYTRCDRG